MHNKNTVQYISTVQLNFQNICLINRKHTLCAEWISYNRSLGSNLLHGLVFHTCAIVS